MHPVSAPTELLLPLIGECDCCTRKDVPLERVMAFGIETFACAVCRGDDEPEEGR